MVNRIINGRAKFPFILNIELTDYCPLNCKQCYKNAKTTFIEWERLVQLINEAHAIGTRKILLSGGEPLTYPYLIDALSLIKEKGIYVCISTGGCGLDEYLANNLKNSGIDDIFISLNGSTREINMLSRDGYNKAVHAMELLASMHIAYRINWVARKDNLDDFEKLIDFCKLKKAVGIEVLSNKPNYKGYVDSPLDKKQLYQLAEICKANSDYVQYQTCFIQLDRLLRSTNSFFKGCLAGKASMAVFADGTFSICPHLYTGDTYQRIRDFWNDCKCDKQISCSGGEEFYAEVKV